MRVAASLVLTIVCFAQSPKDPFRTLADTAMAARPPEWYTHAYRIARGMPGVNAEERAWIREETKAGGDIVMSVLIDLETLAPPAPRK